MFRHGNNDTTLKGRTMKIELDNAVVYHGSNLDVLPTLPDNSVDSIVTDPPYELGFMGKSWDSSGIAYSVQLWTECMRVLKPGGHLLAFSAPRTYHRMTVAIEDAGFEIRDMISWVSNKTFPKSHNISKAIDKAAGATREVIGQQKLSGTAKMVGGKNPDGIFTDKSKAILRDFTDITAASTPEAQQWEGWGTGLKPTVEPIVMARKPLEGTIASNVLKHGVGGINIDASRIGTETITITNGKGFASSFGGGVNDKGGSTHVGRWPANIILDPDAAAIIDEQSGISKSTGIINRWTNGAQPFGNGAGKPYESIQGVADEGGASRFFYVAKASKADRNEGMGETSNAHPTVKPTSLMTYLIKLITPEGGTVLDPFTGSGSTGKAALLNGFKFIGIELTDEYLPIIEGRLTWANQQHNQTEEETKLF